MTDFLFGVIAFVIIVFAGGGIISSARLGDLERRVDDLERFADWCILDGKRPFEDKGGRAQ